MATESRVLGHFELPSHIHGNYKAKYKHCIYGFFLNQKKHPKALVETSVPSTTNEQTSVATFMTNEMYKKGDPLQRQATDALVFLIAKDMLLLSLVLILRALSATSFSKIYVYQATNR